MCYNCGNFGHLADRCNEPRSTLEVFNKNKAEDERRRYHEHYGNNPPVPTPAPAPEIAKPPSQEAGQTFFVHNLTLGSSASKGVKVHNSLLLEEYKKIECGTTIRTAAARTNGIFAMEKRPASESNEDQPEPAKVKYSPFGNPLRSTSWENWNLQQAVLAQQEEEEALRMEKQKADEENAERMRKHAAYQKAILEERPWAGTDFGFMGVDDENAQAQRQRYLELQQEQELRKEARKREEDMLKQQAQAKDKGKRPEKAHAVDVDQLSRKQYEELQKKMKKRASELAAAAKRKPSEKSSPGAIRMMENQPSFDHVAAVRDSTITIKMGDFFNLCPLVRKDVATAMGRTRATTKKTGANLQANMMSLKSKLQEDRASEVTNFYTEGKLSQGLRSWPITDILIDGGSVVNIMPEYIARACNLITLPTSNCTLQTATSAVAHITEYTDVELEIAGVICETRIYIMPNNQTEPDGVPCYAILLGRRWLRQVKALGDYANHAYYIHDKAGKPHLMPISKKGVEPSSLPSLAINGRPPADIDADTVSELEMSREQILNALIDEVVRSAEKEMDEMEDEAEDADVESIGSIAESFDEEVERTWSDNDLFVDQSGKARRL